jgi:hypothetical protein
MCTFVLATSNVGVPGRVVAVMDAASSVAQFTEAQKGPSDAVALTGVGDHAFYSSSQSMIQLLKGKNLVIVQATLRVPGGAAVKPGVVKADLTALGQSIASQI